MQASSSTTSFLGAHQYGPGVVSGMYRQGVRMMDWSGIELPKPLLYSFTDVSQGTFVQKKMQYASIVATNNQHLRTNIEHHRLRPNSCLSQAFSNLSLDVWEHDIMRFVSFPRFVQFYDLFIFFPWRFQTWDPKKTQRNLRL